MAAPAYLIDLTRLVSRQGRAMTGVDRVEHAWARHLLSLAETPLFGLVRTRLGFVLLDRRGVARVVDRAEGKDATGSRDLLARVTWPANPARGGAESDLRRIAIMRAPRWFPGRLLRRLPRGFGYLNLGHANLDPRVMRAIHRCDGSRIGVLVHDVIPLDHPEFARDGTPSAFLRKMRVVAEHADLVIHTSRATRCATEAQLKSLGRVPHGITARLGVPDACVAHGGRRDQAVADFDPVIQDMPELAAFGKGPNRLAQSAHPYFVAVGTIEPRKNHALLLDLWARMHATMPQAKVPHLHLAGARGWADPHLLHRLDTAPFIGRTVFEHSALSDAALGKLLQGARALLFPSLAEGYGFPTLEAARMGIPVICTPLAVLRDLLGDYPVYADPCDSYAWLAAIKTMSGIGLHDGKPTRQHPPDLPQWSDHFNTVLTLI